MSDRDPEPDEDEDDPDDRAMKMAREFAPQAVEFLIHVMTDKTGQIMADRLKAADLLLGVAGCL